MEKIIVQIYEIQTAAEAEKLMALGVDHIGSVIVAAKEWKLQSLKDTVQVIKAGNARCSLIPLFSDKKTVQRVIDYYQPDIVHFCETLPLQTTSFDKCNNLLELQTSIKEKFPEVQVMRSIPIAPTNQSEGVPTLELAHLFEPVSDLFLTDTLLFKASDASLDDQPVDGFVGITGQNCDWDMAAKLIESSRIPVILAGGISPENVFDGILRTRPAGVDSCTGTNAVDPQGRLIRFKKDFDKVKQLVAEVRRAEQALMNV